MALISRFGEGEERVRIRAFQRSVANLGMSFGMGIAAIALAMDTRTAYVAMVLGNAASYFAAAIFILQFPAMPPIAPVNGAGRVSGFIALRDRHFLVEAEGHACRLLAVA